MTLIAPTTKCDCPVCEGKGEVLIMPNVHDWHFDFMATCLTCNGTGKVEYKDWVKITGRD